MPPKEAPVNYYFYDAPLEEDTYESGLPKEHTVIIRKGLQSFESQEKADEWAVANYSVVEKLHTARCFAWRIDARNNGSADRAADGL
jgi:hypothetical protein